jgi:uncharacterized repeat protein (TIGR03806 family)
MMNTPGVACGFTPAGGQAVPIKLTSVVTGAKITRPIQLLSAPDGSKRAFIVAQNGHVYVTAGSPDIATPVTDYLSIEQRIDSTGAQSGLLSMAFDPGFAQNGFIYLSSTRQMAGSLQLVISRMTVAMPASGIPDPASEVVLLAIPLQASTHVSGPLVFGPDNYLYIGTSDGGQDGDPQGNASNLGSLLGKILRIDVSQGGSTYAVPMSNPFVGQSGDKGEIYAYGFRNPYRISIDALSGVMWAGDQGQSRTEELNNVQAGANYGWNSLEGIDCYMPMTGCNRANINVPSISYPRTQGAEVVGGQVYRGLKAPGLYGAYVFGDEVSGTLWISPVRDDQLAGYDQVALGHTDRKIAGFGTDADGEMYVLDNQDGAICRIDPADGPVTPPTWPLLLSQTPYFKDLKSRKLVSGVLSYDVNVPLWSDGAAKERGLYLPPGTQITYADNVSAWSFPMGSVVIKSFLLGGKPIETRLLRHESDGWHGATYRWNAGSTEGNLMTTNASVMISGQSWPFPSRADCQACHTTASGQVLGLTTAQLNLSHDMLGTGTSAPQLDTLKQIKAFSNPPAGDASTLPTLPAATDTSASIDQRARAYLHANCAHCHQPGGLAEQTFDIRYTTSLSQTGVCNAQPQKGDTGVTGALLLSVGKPDMSVMWLRMTSLNPTLRMPLIGSHVVDTTGSALIYNWIQNLTSCN